MRKRFLRDHALDAMVTEIRTISEKLSSKDFPGFVFSKSLESLTEMYAINQIVLKYIEEAIEELRRNGDRDTALTVLVSAAAHVQIGLVSIHSSLKEDVDLLLSQVMELKNALGVAEEEIEPGNTEITFP